MSLFFFFLFWAIVFTNCMNVEEGLVSVALVYRHGDRTPISTYPNDPYSNASYWPVGFAELTNEGKMQQFELGQWFRDRYKKFLPDQYSEKDVYIHSTDVDRTLMSAQLNLAGLFPPQNNQIWNDDLMWQPIPVHTIPEVEDNIIRMTMPCEKYTRLYEKLLQSPEFVKINEKNHFLYSYLTKYSGMEVKNINGVEHIYSTLKIERKFNYTLPKWTDSVFPDKMAPWAHLSFALDSYTPELARLKSGPLLNNILENFVKITNHKGYKFVAYSAHDTTVANTLKALNLFDYHSPPYTATIFFELRYLNNSYFINILYKNTSVPQELTLNGCEFLCPLDKFRNILKPILITPKQWKQECHVSKATSIFSFINSSGFFIFSIVLLFVISFVVIVCIRDRVAHHNYIVLPN